MSFGPPEVSRTKLFRMELERLERLRLARLRTANARAFRSQSRRGGGILAGQVGTPAVVRAGLLGETALRATLNAEIGNAPQTLLGA